MASAVRGTLIGNAITLYFLQGVAYVFPLLIIPYVVRVLKPSGWGTVALAQSFSQLLILCIEYGFQLSATRELALNRGSLKFRSQILFEVLGARGVLFAVVAGLVLSVNVWVPVFDFDPRLVYSALLLAAGQGFSMAWYYQGLEQLRPLLITELTSRTAAAAGIFLFVRTPEDAWKVLAIDGCAALAACAGSCAWAARGNAIILPAWWAIFERLRNGWHIFCYRAALALYSVGNPLLLGLFAPASTVGFFVAADRLARAFLALVYPLAQVLYPRINFLVRSDRPAAARIARIGLVLSAVFGTALAVVVFAAAPLLVKVVLSPEFAATIPVLRILALLCPLIAVNTTLSFQYLLPRHLERHLNWITVLAGAFNIWLALLLAPNSGASGMAWAVVCAELLVLISFSLVLFRKQNAPAALWK